MTGEPQDMEAREPAQDDGARQPDEAEMALEMALLALRVQAARYTGA